MSRSSAAPKSYPPEDLLNWTPRQREVLELLARGKSNAEIAEALGISLEGAKYHVREIMSKLDVESQEEAADYWRQRNGLPERLRRAWSGMFGFAQLKWLAAGGASVVVVGFGGIALAIALGGNAGAPDATQEDTVAPATATAAAILEAMATPTAVHGVQIQADHGVLRTGSMLQVFARGLDDCVGQEVEGGYFGGWGPDLYIRGPVIEGGFFVSGPLWANEPISAKRASIRGSCIEGGIVKSDYIVYAVDVVGDPVRTPTAVPPARDVPINFSWFNPRTLDESGSARLGDEIILTITGLVECAGEEVELGFFADLTLRADLLAVTVVGADGAASVTLIVTEQRVDQRPGVIADCLGHEQGIVLANRSLVVFDVMP